jgi:hypothetical protein
MAVQIRNRFQEEYVVRVGVAALVICAVWVLAHATGEDLPYFSLEYQQAVNPEKHFPVELGNRWTYENVYRSAVGSAEGVVEVTWRSDVVIQAHHVVPEGMVVLCSKRIYNVMYDYPDDTTEQELPWFKKNVPDMSAAHYIIAGNYVYEISDDAWDADKVSLTRDYSQAFGEGTITPKFFFPLGAVRMWSERVRERADRDQSELFKQGQVSAPNPGMYYWVVEDQQNVEVPFGLVSAAFRLVYRTVGGSATVWFKPGLGVIKETYRHFGTYLESESVLLSFAKGDGSLDLDE